MIMVPEKNHAIFQLKAPYKNPYQGTSTKILSVCSAGLLRAPTFATVGAQMGFNTRSAGVHDYALVQINANLIMWADKIVFMQNYLLGDALKLFADHDVIKSVMKEKAVVLDIYDDYNYMQEELVKKATVFLESISKNDGLNNMELQQIEEE